MQVPIYECELLCLRGRKLQLQLEDIQIEQGGVNVCWLRFTSPPLRATANTYRESEHHQKLHTSYRDATSSHLLAHCKSPNTNLKSEQKYSSSSNLSKNGPLQMHADGPNQKLLACLGYTHSQTNKKHGQTDKHSQWLSHILSLFPVNLRAHRPIFGSLARSHYSTYWMVCYRNSSRGLW